MNSDMSMQDRIKRYVDGELSSADAATLERELAGNPSLQSHVQFELHLRHRVQAVMEGDASKMAPAELRGAITSTLAAEGNIPESAVIGRVSSQPGEVAPDSAQGTHRARLTQPRRVNFLAVAASLALVAGAVLFGIFAPQITRFQFNQPQTTRIDLSQTAAPFAADEHSRCTGDAERRKRQLEFTDIAAASTALGTHLASHVVVPDFGPLNYEFIAAGRSDVPVDEPSGHAFYRSKGSEERRPCLSVFFFADRGQFMLPEKGHDLPLPPGRSCEAGRSSKCHRKVKVFSDGQTVYVLSACDQDKLEAAVQLLEDALVAAAR